MQKGHLRIDGNLSLPSISWKMSKRKHDDSTDPFEVGDAAKKLIGGNEMTIEVIIHE